jgi:hypothetical protein
MNSEYAPRSRAAQISGVIAVLFGLATLGAGASVLAGRDPGYQVYRVLLVFNTLMGMPYVVAGVLAWRQARAGWLVAAAIAGVNAFVLIYIVFLYRTGGAVALDSVRAMVLRTGVWLVLLVVLLWARRVPRLAGPLEESRRP